MRPWIIIVAFVALLAGCADGARSLSKPPVALGDFSLGHNIVVTPNVVMSPVSRRATDEQLEEAMKNAIAERFGRYNGAKDYHFGISVDGYSLAPPGVPLVFTPKSALIVTVTVWDDAAGKKLNEKAKQITVLESFGTAPIIGSGYTLSAEEQLVQLTRNAAKAIEDYMVKQSKEEGWFQPETPADETDTDPATTTG